MDMRIQYGDMNVYRDLPGGVATGLGLGLQARKIRNQEQKENVPNITIPDPGQKPVVDINQLTQAEQKDISRYMDLEKKAKGLDETAMYDVRVSAVDRTQSPIVKQAMLMGIPAKELSEYMKDIKTEGIKSPSGQILKGRLGGENSAGWQEVQKKVAEVQATQKQLDEQYDIKLKDTLSFVLDFQNDPRKYSNKGITPDQVKKMVDASGDYLVELWKNPANREWVNNWLNEKQNIMRRTGGAAAKGYQPQYDEYGRAMTFNKDTGRYEYAIDPQTGQPYRMNIPASQADVIGAAISGNLSNLSKKTNPEPPPRNVKNKPNNQPSIQNKVATEAVIKEYIRKYGKDKALEKLKADGYK